MSSFSIIVTFLLAVSSWKVDIGPQPQQIIFIFWANPSYTCFRSFVHIPHSHLSVTEVTDPKCSDPLVNDHHSPAHCSTKLNTCHVGAAFHLCWGWISLAACDMIDQSKVCHGKMVKLMIMSMWKRRIKKRYFMMKIGKHLGYGNSSRPLLLFAIS